MASLWEALGWAVAIFAFLFGFYYLCATMWMIFHPRVAMTTWIMALRSSFTAGSLAAAWWVWESFLR